MQRLFLRLAFLAMPHLLLHFFHRYASVQARTHTRTATSVLYIAKGERCAWELRVQSFHLWCIYFAIVIYCLACRFLAISLKYFTFRVSACRHEINIKRKLFSVIHQHHRLQILTTSQVFYLEFEGQMRMKLPVLYSASSVWPNGA